MPFSPGARPRATRTACDRRTGRTERSRGRA
jgi:hypothetical protein